MAKAYLTVDVLVLTLSSYLRIKSHIEFTKMDLCLNQMHILSNDSSYIIKNTVCAIPFGRFELIDFCKESYFIV